MPVTAKDVARELNLSQPTVSRILSGARGHRASEETRMRVEEAARRLGYRPNAVAQSLRRGRTGIIGIHSNHNYDARNDFYGTVIGALQCACRIHRLDLLLHSAIYGSSVEEMVDKLRDGRIDGLILHANSDDPLVEILSRSALPVVAVADPLPGLPSVTCDDGDGMRQLIANLWGKGYRDFVFLAPDVQLASVERRCGAFESELQRRNVAATHRQVISIEFEMCAPALDTLLQRGTRTAVCCWNDRTAYNLLQECARREVSVPQELAIVGFDGLRDEKLPARTLLTARCPWEDVATRALEWLVELIDSGSEASESVPEARELRLPVALLEGDTA
ncbi:MAG TPA: LacI family DNA-binding transcriptional regulator [Abditibacteriaceae bacterium]|jgi:DNA-binding LacI/PurR family transcriptional regulator